MMFEAYVTNLGMYPERGVEVGEYLKFPTTIEEMLDGSLLPLLP